MNEIKVNLNVVLPGRTMLSKEECLKTIQKTVERTNKKTGKTYKKTVTSYVDDFDKMDRHILHVVDGYVDNKPVKEVLEVHTRKSRPAAQSLNLCKEAYEYMTSKDCPSWSKPKVWNVMNKKERLEAHLQRITEGLGGVSYTYQVFED